jgi:hypothetical protein
MPALACFQLSKIPLLALALIASGVTLPYVAYSLPCGMYGPKAQYLQGFAYVSPYNSRLNSIHFRRFCVSIPSRG